MNSLEKEMLCILKDLKENHNVIAIKSEFEAEGSRTREMVKLNEVVFRADMDFYIKIGGCEAVRDLDECRMLGASGIMAPMIETPFAMSKFISAVNKTYNQDEKDNIEFIINVETITCFNNFDEIMEVEGFDLIGAIVVGRVDFAGSIGLTRNKIDSEEVLNYTKIFLEKAKKKGIIVGVGGGIGLESVPFIKELRDVLDRFETRKVVYKLPEAYERIEEGLLKAMQFETLFLKNKNNYYSSVAKEDEARIAMMENRILKVKEEIKK